MLHVWEVFTSIQNSRGYTFSERLAPNSPVCRGCEFRDRCQGDKISEAIKLPPLGETPVSRWHDNNEWEKACEDYLEADIAFRQADEAKKEARKSLEALVGDRPIVEGNRLRVYWKPTTSERLDSRALKKDHPEIASKYMKKSHSRPFKVYEV